MLSRRVSAFHPKETFTFTTHQYTAQSTPSFADRLHWHSGQKRLNNRFGGAVVNDDSEQEALFYIEGPDERGCVWMHGASSRDPWHQNLGPTEKVAELLSQWLGSIEYDEQNPTGRARSSARSSLLRVAEPSRNYDQS